MKKLLALVLALVMVMGLSVVSTSAAYADAAKIEHSEAVDVLSSLDVVGGKENNNFDPTGNVKRSEMAKMITISVLGDVDVSAFTGTATDLTDIDGHWAEGYIKYCYSQGIIGGRGNGKFDPDANVTAAEAAKMCLVALGYNADVQGYIGDQWAINVTRDAQLKGLYEELSGLSSGKVLTRDETAQMIYNTLDAVRIEATKGVDSNGVITTTYHDATNAATDTLLEKTFGMQKYEGFMDGAAYNTSTKRYSYTFRTGTGATDVATGGTSDQGPVYSETDYSDYFGQKVEMLWKTDKKTGDKIAYGIVKDCNTVTATWGELDNGTDTTDKKTKVAEVEYSLNAAEAAIPVYGLAANADAVLGNLTTALVPASTLTLVDQNKDGKYDYAVVIPATVAKVTYVSAKSITADAVYKFADDDIESGIAKDDFVKIVAATNTAKGAAIITKLETVEGTVAAMGGTKINLNGTWYKQGAANGDAANVGDTDRLYIVGDYYYNVKKIDGKSFDDVLMVLEAGLYQSGLQDGAEAKVMFAKDGAVSTIKVSKTEGTAVTTNVETVDKTNYKSVSGSNTTTTYSTAGDLVIGGMYTYKLKDGAYELTALESTGTSTNTSTIGTWKFGSYTGGATTDAYDYSASNSVIKVATLGNAQIADDAIVMAYRGGATTKTVYTTGATLKTWKTDWGNYAQVLYKNVNGVPTASLIAVYGKTAVPGTSGSTHYGYVTNDSALIKEGDDYFMVMSMWTDEGQLTNVKAESYTGGATTVTNNAALAGNANFLKGAFVSYEKLSSGNIGSVTALTVDPTFAITGSYVNKDGDTVLTLDADGKAGGAITATLDKDDTKVIYVNTDDKTGADGGDVNLATETAVSGAYIQNVVAAKASAAAVNNDVLDVLFVDVNNNLATNGKTVTPATGTYITSVTAGTGSNELVIATGNNGTNVAAEAAGWTGAIGAAVIQSNGTVRAGTTLATTDTLRVVAEDGTVFEYAINSVTP